MMDVTPMITLHYMAKVRDFHSCKSSNQMTELIKSEIILSGPTLMR